MLHNNSFVCFAIMAPIAPIVDFSLVGGWVQEQDYTAPLVAIIFVSAMVALLLNLACFVIIGHKGPIAFQVVGYLKTVLVFVGGHIIFGEHYEFRKICGVVTAIGGLVYYSHIKSVVDSDARAMSLKIPDKRLEAEKLLEARDSLEPDVIK